jgi:hypothetical protein
MVGATLRVILSQNSSGHLVYIKGSFAEKSMYPIFTVTFGSERKNVASTSSLNKDLLLLWTAESPSEWLGL